MSSANLSVSNGFPTFQAPVCTQEEASEACGNLRGLSKFIHYAKLRHFLKNDAIAGKRLFTFEMFIKAVHDKAISPGARLHFLSWDDENIPETTFDDVRENLVFSRGSRSTFTADQVEAIELVESVEERFQKQIQEVVQCKEKVPNTLFSQLFIGLLRQHAQHCKKQAVPESVIQKLAVLEKLDLSDVRIEFRFRPIGCESERGRFPELNNYVISTIAAVCKEYFPSLKQLVISASFLKSTIDSRVTGSIKDGPSLYQKLYERLKSQNSSIQFRERKNFDTKRVSFTNEVVDCTHAFGENSSSRGQVPQMSNQNDEKSVITLPPRPVIAHRGATPTWFTFERFTEALKLQQLHFGDQLRVTAQGTVRCVVTDITFYSVAENNMLYGKNDQTYLLCSKEKIKEIVLLRSVVDVARNIIHQVTASKEQQPLGNEHTSELFLYLLRQQFGHVEKSAVTLVMEKLLSQVTVIDLSDRYFTFKLGQVNDNDQEVAGKICAIFNNVLITYFPACKKLILSSHSSSVLMEERSIWKTGLCITTYTSRLEKESLEVQMQESKVVRQEELIFIK